MLIPSIDLMNGKAVQLIQGRKKVLERNNPIELAKEFNKYGEVAVIDLDAALGKGNNYSLIKEICKISDCRVGGGIRSIKIANEYLRAGAKKIIVGTKANPTFLQNFPKNRIIVAIDTNNGFVMTKGWTKKTQKTIQTTIQRLQNYCSEFLLTNINKEGLMQGSDIKNVKKFSKLTTNKITIAGGINSIKEILAIENLGINSQLGMSIYTKKINLCAAYLSLLDLKKNNGLIPTIVQDENNQVLMLAYSSKKSLRKFFTTGKATYYSRSRKKLWKKGESSGNFQELIKVRYDCDRDSLLITVKQKNYACHMKRYSCFGEKQFKIEELYDVIKENVKNPKKNSYTSNISQTENKIKEKIVEECSELVNYKNKENLIWESADLLYFVLVLLAKKNISWNNVKNELWRRRK